MNVLLNQSYYFKEPGPIQATVWNIIKFTGSLSEVEDTAIILQLLRLCPIP